MTTRAEHFQAGAEHDDRYHGESDSQYRRRKRLEARMAEHQAKYPVPSDPFQGIPSGD